MSLFFGIVPKSAKSLETNEELPKTNVSKTNRQNELGLLLLNEKCTVGYKLAAFVISFRRSVSIFLSMVN